MEKTVTVQDNAGGQPRALFQKTEEHTALLSPERSARDRPLFCDGTLEANPEGIYILER